ncbi:hypothetical protein ACHAPX_007910 [Trichoderma viride]
MVMAHGVSSGKTQPVFSSDCAKGFIFLGTPHSGSELTIFAKILSLLGYWQGASTALLEVIDPRSLENKSLHEDFLYRFGNREMVNFYEVQPEYVGPFPIMNAVKKDSATILQKDNIPSPVKHRALHRFMSETDVGYTHLYQKVKSLVDQNIEKQGVPDVSAIKAHSVDVETDFRENFQLEKMLNNLLESKEYLEVRIVLDGIDELHPEDLGRFLSNLREVWNNIKGKLNTASKLKVLIVSRPFPNISEILKDLPFINPEKESTGKYHELSAWPILFKAKERKLNADTLIDCLNSLSSMADNQRRGIISLGSEKTGAWLWEDDAYKLWSKETKSALLWIQGKPGSGKSTLCKKILRHLQTQHSLPDTYAAPDKAPSHDIAPQPRHRSVLLASFFYSLRGAKSEISNTHMLQSLLYQLLGQEQRLYPAFKEKYRSPLDRSQSPISWTFKDLHDVFTSLGEFNDFSLTIYLVIDAMDESEQSERSDILLLLQHFCQNKSACVIKSVLASRPEEDIKDSLLDIRESHNFFHLVLEKKNEADIKKFIEIAMCKVQDVYLAQRPAVAAEFKEMVTCAANNLENKARGVFMWVEIVTRELERVVRRGVSLKGFKEIVDGLPGELEPFYERIVQDLMARFKRQRQKEAESRLREAQRMLTWVTFAERPLSVSEFCDAVAIPELVEENSGINLQDYRLLDDIAVRQRMSVICGDLLEIGSLQDSTDVSLRDTKTIVQLLHLTVREFLISDPRAGKFLMEKNRGEYEIFLNCISYLRLFAENCPAPNPATDGDDPNHEEIVRYLANWPLLSYILEFLIQHMQNSDNCDQISDVGAKFTDFILHQEGSSAFLILEAWLHKAELCMHSHSLSERAANFRFDCMNTATAEGYLSVVATLLEAETAATTDNKYGNLLYNTSCRGIFSLTHLLLWKGVDPSSTGEDGNTALQAASAHGHRDVVMLLLDYGADVNAQGKDERALYAAAKNSSWDIVELLLDHGADVNAQGISGSALHAAAKSGPMRIVKILLKKGADVNARTPNGNALYAAVKYGSTDIAKTFLGQGADITAQGEERDIPHTAIENGSVDIIRLFLDPGAVVSAQGVNGSALDATVKNGSGGIIRLLLKKWIGY